MKLADIATVDRDQIDKCLYFLSHVIRKCRILNRTLLSMTYHEQGKIEIEMMDAETGQVFHEPAKEDVKPAAADEDDPLS